MRKASHHLAHRRQTFIAFGRQAHPVSLRHIMQQQDALVARLQRGFRHRQTAITIGMGQRHLARRLGRLQVIGHLAPGLAVQLAAKQLLGSAIGLHHPISPIHHHHPCRQGSHQHGQALGQLHHLPLQRVVGSG
ncbi:hypothetical protein SDC9_183712 [bioreactor metagenome]|uniref:Uncharacterized protein n=1 Tax=bioreactor metagenome TaxID=1076179 RepID=A0A645HJ99_9ZZZZ